MFFSGWSGVGGQIKNFYVISWNFCGFFFGLGVFVFVNLMVLVVGIEINGLIVCFLYVNGIVGIKLIVGLISCFGVIFIFFM